jgi:hypothetical protein
MPLRKRHKVPKKIAAPAKAAPSQPSKTTPVNIDSLPIQAEHLLENAKNVEMLENILGQINAYYDRLWEVGSEVLPIMVGITPEGLLVELSAVRDKSQAGEQVHAKDLNVFTYKLGTQLHDIEPREIAEVNMVKGQEQIRLHNEDAPMPDMSDGRAMAHWRFIEAETIQLKTLGVYEIQPENYSQVSFGHGIKDLGGTEDAIIPLQHFAAEIK